MPETFDIAILGGGAAGSAAALTLLATGARVCVIEASDFSEVRVGETIPPDANALLFDLGVHADFLEQGHLPCYGSHSLWGSTQLGHNDFLTSPHGHGWHLDRARFDRWLLDRAVAAGARRVVAEGRAQARADRVMTLSAGGEEIGADWFVDATGRNGALARACGATRRHHDRQTVIWARFQVSEGALGNSTWLESAPYGWWYAAELPGGEAVIALGADPHVAKAEGLYDLRRWATALTGTNLIAPKIARARLVPDSFRITASHGYLTDRVVGENWLAVGDAASAFDPLSSAGIYKALATGKRAARAILEGDTEPYRGFVRDSYAQYLEAHGTYIRPVS